MDKDFLRSHNLFFLVKPNELENFNEWCEYLESLLAGQCSVMPIGGKLTLLEIKARVFSIGGLKFEIYPNEHTPPHFHVKTHDFEASFRIDNCELISGELPEAMYRKVVFWHKQGVKDLLIEKWDSTRPTKCVVGKYVE